MPCGSCIDCRLEYSRQWAVRIMHEARGQETAFVTLTYAPEFLPLGGTLVKGDFQRFMRKLRKLVGPVRFFHCGEYGSENRRPHYHAALFGVSFPDKVIFKRSRKGFPIYTSGILTRAWSRNGVPIGHASFGELTFESAAYVARYVTKKVNGKGRTVEDPLTGLRPYERVDPLTGEVFEVAPEYTTMSRRPGIGAKFIEEFADDVFPGDRVVSRGRAAKPPRYYDEWLRRNRPEEFEAVKAARKVKAEANEADSTQERLEARAKVSQAKLRLADPVRDVT